jgi:hypothetical protein
MSIDSTILAGRALMESLMDSTCVITRTSGGSIDPSTGLLSGGTATTIYSGVCRLRYASVRPTQVDAEGQNIAEERGVLSLPVVGDSTSVTVGSSAAVRVNDIATITLGPLDPAGTVVGRIELPHAQTQATARRFPLQVLS